MAKRLGSVRRRPALALLAALVLVVAVAYFGLGRDTTIEPRLVASQPVAAIGSGAEAAAVAADGSVLTWVSPEDADSLPSLPLESPPQGGRVKGTALAQVKVLAAAPPALFPYVEGSRFGESGVDVVLASGVELRFGEAAQAARKWRAAAAVLADPSVTALDYVNLQSPGHPSTGGSGHTLPPPP